MDKAVTTSNTLVSYNDYNKNNTRINMSARKNYDKKHKKKKKFRGIVNILIICLFIFMCIIISRFLSSLIFDLIDGHNNTGNENYNSEVISGTEKNNLIKQLKEENYPESLVTLFEKHPETKDFVLDYKNYKDKKTKINIKKDVSTDGIPLFLQWDKRWGYRNYGGDFIAVTGCGPTCLSMVQCGLSGKAKWNPYRVARMAENNGFYVKGSGSSWDLMTYGASKIGLNYNEVLFEKESILAWLNSGNPIICSMGPGDFTTTGHFIVLSGTDSNGNIIVNDPNSKENSSKTWALDKIMPQMRNLWGYSL